MTGSDYRPVINLAPFDLADMGCRFLVDADGRQCPVVARSRRRITVDRYGTRYHLRRRRLEQNGFDYIGGRLFAVSRYYVPGHRAA